MVSDGEREMNAMPQSRVGKRVIHVMRLVKKLPVGMSSCSSGKSRNWDYKYVGDLNADEQELVPTGSFLRGA